MEYQYTQSMVDYYNQTNQQDRLSSGIFRLEYARTIEIIERYLPLKPAVIYDVGCGGGHYASYFAQKGYIMSVLDPVAKHIEQAKLLSNAHPKNPISSFHLGDARDLPFKNESADVVLLGGPLYHLLNRSDRIIALKESKRVLKPRGLLIATYIARFATTFLEGIGMNFFTDPQFIIQAKEIAKTGLIRGNDFFTDAYCHELNEIEDEIREVDLQFEKIIPVEGIGCILNKFDYWWNNKRKELMFLVKEYESVLPLMGLTSHLIGISKKSR